MDRPRITDTRATLETPEGTDLPLHPAGFWVRTLAYGIDWLIRAVVVGVISIAIGHGGLGQALSLITYFLLEWFYPVAFEVWRDGQTIGKKRMHLKVIHDDGTPVTFAASLIRNLLRVVDWLPMFYVAGILTTICNREFKRIGDFAGGTMVVYVHAQAEQPALEAVGTAPIPDGVDTDEQRVLLAFAQRSQSMTAARQLELARMLTPMIGPEDPVTHIKQMGNHIVGHR